MLKNFVNYYTYFLYKNMIIASLSSSSVRVDVQRITRDFFLGDNLECTRHNNRELSIQIRSLLKTRPTEGNKLETLLEEILGVVVSGRA